MLTSRTCRSWRLFLAWGWGLRFQLLKGICPGFSRRLARAHHHHFVCKPLAPGARSLHQPGGALSNRHKHRRLHGRRELCGKAVLVVWGLFVIAGIFYLIAFTFMSIGQRLGQLFDQFPPLTAYSINVGASFLGIALFTLMSYLSLPPKYWLLAGIVMALWFYRKWWQVSLLGVSLLIAFMTNPADVIWSPYYRISVADIWIGADGKYPAIHYGHTINVNYDAIEGAYDNSPKTTGSISEGQRKQLLDYYNMLFDVIGNKPREMLILAAGAGNDLAAALRNGATYIDAVEIDPVIVRLGRELHPEKPYDNPAVHVVVDDARAFLKRSNRKYDLVDFAYLDSHSAFSSMSSIRLDNYIYTVRVSVKRPN